MRMSHVARMTESCHTHTPAKEKRDFAVKQRVLDLVKQRNDTIDHGPSYVMPEVCAYSSVCQVCVWNLG